LATLGWRRLSKGQRDNLLTLQPIYLRAPHITKPKHRTPSLGTTDKRTGTKQWKSPN
jgi:hypothetical protein